MRIEQLGSVPETIFALSSGAPPAAIGVIRVSGPAAADAVRALAGRLPPPRRASLRTLRDAQSEVLDRALLLWFPGPKTATGEDLAEFHVHGGRAVVQGVLQALAVVPGLRAAEPGEFTRRAFANGVIDLAEAEGLADLLAAETETQRRAALAMAGGVLSRKVEQWRITLLELSALVEAEIEFADEGEAEVDGAIVRERVAALAEEIAALLASPPAERLRDGVRVVIAGPPNAGKSTLLNALVGREAAITSPEAGTTRDVIEAPVVLAGIPFLLTDTAGLRESESEIERIGVARAEEARASADIVLWLGEAGRRPERALQIHAQADVNSALDDGSADAIVSARTGFGMDRLVGTLADRARALLPREDELALSTRQRTALGRALEPLTTLPADPVLLAEALATARRGLDRVLGRAGVEEMLDTLFHRFCIGK